MNNIYIYYEKYIYYGNSSLSIVVRTHNNRCIIIPSMKNQPSV
uniref:Uncharacterized protein n=1 Tax=viral metagenome TaxID=1070528 RepID=A0A6C0JWV1_9ZZZZ